MLTHSDERAGIRPEFRSVQPDNGPIEPARGNEHRQGHPFGSARASFVGSRAHRCGYHGRLRSDPAIPRCEAAQIVAVQNATRDAVTAIQGIGATIGQISEIAAAIAEAVEGQRSATQQIGEKVQGVAHSSGVANSGMAAVTSSAEQTGTAAAGGHRSRRAETRVKHVECAG
jgi:hypothetical protein